MVDNTNYRDTMESYAKDWKIFIDTCSLLQPESQQFWYRVIPLLQQYQNKIIIPFKVIEELQKHSNNQRKPDLAERASYNLKIIEQLIQSGHVEIRGEESDNFTDNVFLVVFTKFRMTHKLLLITQDNCLAKDILALNDTQAVKANKVQVKKINKQGLLTDFKWYKPTPVINENEKFRLCSDVTTISDTVLKVSYIPGENDVVYTSQGSIRLENKVAAGGEGVIYETNTPYVAKIYMNNHNTQRRYEKIKLMLSKKIECEGICYPTTMLYNSNKEFVGYLMPKAKGKELQKSLFIKPLFLKNFPDWKKKDTVELCITILKKIKYLHDRNIILGDINPANILVVSPKEVYFVDVDSYQIENFPCPVGTVNYTAPEIQGKSYSDFLRTIGNENFAVATLLFMIMLPGKPPYSQQGGENPVKNITNMNFSYPLGEHTNKKTPAGPWRFIWSHLPYKVKEAFYHTFRKNGRNSTEETRLSINEWLRIFNNYLRLLNEGIMYQQDEMSEMIYPTRNKKTSKFTYIKCRLCNNEVPEQLSQEGICKECLNDGETHQCKRCGKELLFTNYQKYIRNAKPRDYCQDCFSYNKEVWRTLYCTTCGQLFTLTNEQHDAYVDMGYEIPKRCKSCRESKKDVYSRPHTSYTPDYTSYTSSTNTTSSSHSHSKSRGSFCFLTTVVCDYLGKEDDCVELTMLRCFRDNWLRNQPDGQLLIAEYYNKAPVIVSKMIQAEDFDYQCHYLWDNYIQPCLTYIAHNENERCKEHYIEMVRYAQAKFYDVD